MHLTFCGCSESIGLKTCYILWHVRHMPYDIFVYNDVDFYVDGRRRSYFVLELVRKILALYGANI